MSTARKGTFINRSIRAWTDVSQAIDVLRDLYKTFNDRGYNIEGSNPITQEELEPSGLSLEDFTAGIALLDQISRFFNGEDTTIGDWEAVLNRVRGDF